MKVYERIKALRISRGMSQLALAQKVGYAGKSAICKVENGERDITVTMLERYAEALGVSVGALFGCGELPPSQNRFQLAGRDGTFLEGPLTDAQMKAFQLLLSSFPEARDED